MPTFRSEHFVNYDQVLFAEFFTELYVQYGEGIHRDRAWVTEAQLLPNGTVLATRAVCRIQFHGGESLVLYDDAANSQALRMDAIDTQRIRRPDEGAMREYAAEEEHR